MPGLLFLLVGVFCFCSAVHSSNEHMLSLIAAGKINVACASWWGFDEEDATDALQAAINSGVKKLVVDNTGKPWVVRPITLASNQTIVFEPGVQVVAKRGEFKGKNDCLFSAANKQNITLVGYGAILRMWRSDYDAPPYEKAEWRHVLSFRSCSNINVRGLTLAESGGDGIYLGTATRGVTNKNVIIKDVTCLRNYRQGISVITAENLLIENTVMRDTAGTPPQAGIDFEPNRPDECLVNVVMRNCMTSGNQGDGYELYLVPLNQESRPVSIRIENCRSVNDNYSVRVATGNGKGKAVKGIVEFINCEFRNGRKSGIVVSNKPTDGCALRFTECTIIDTGSGQPHAVPILFASGKEATEPIGGVEIRDCVVRDTPQRNPIGFIDASGRLSLQEVSGTIILDKNGEHERLEITPELIAIWTKN